MSLLTKTLTTPLPVSSAIVKVMGVLSFAILTALGAYIAIPLPFTPVPITLQTLFVLLSGAILGAIEGSLSQILYITIGALGMPVYAGATGGFAHILGPTGGYLIGFVISSFIAGIMCKRSTRAWKVFFGFSIAELPIFLLGLTFLATFTHSNLIVTLKMGLLPFIPGEIIKIGTAGSIMKTLRHLRKAVNLK